jgi:KDO2-lipid IV(A) lauroyltransferase
MIFLFYALQIKFFFIFLLPPGLALSLMRLSSEIVYQLAKRTPIKKTVARNLNTLFPDVPADKLADKLLRNVSYSIFEILCTPYFKEAHIKVLGKVVGLSNLDLALARRKGALIILMHTGNYELSHVLLSPYNYKMNVTLKASADPLYKLINRSRSYHGTKLINVLETDMYKESIKALSNNEIVSLLIDTGALESRHEIIDFLGQKVPVAIGWLTLAQRSEAAVLPCYSKREGNQVVFTMGEPLFVQSNNREEIKNKVKCFFENFIKAHPEQWAIFLNEFETKRMVENH